MRIVDLPDTFGRPGPVFPIPMRGNERDLPTASSRARVARFPIPMRGNEIVDADGVWPAGTRVPNPHEG